MDDRSGPRVAAGGLAVAVLGALLVLGAALGYRTGIVALGTSFTLLRWGAYAGVAAIVVSIGAAVLAARRRPVPVTPLAMALAGVVVGGICYALPARQQAIARAVPPIHDITTDLDDPPAFVDVLPLRAHAPNPADYDPSVAPQQREGYPDLGPVRLDLAPAAAFERAQAVVEAMGWEVVAIDADAGRIEATDTTLWYGFKDDVVIRVRPEGGGSRVDVRSKSRVGRSDVGANAARIRAYARRLTGS